MRCTLADRRMPTSSTTYACSAQYGINEIQQTCLEVSREKPHHLHGMSQAAASKGSWHFLATLVEGAGAGVGSLAALALVMAANARATRMHAGTRDMLCLQTGDCVMEVTLAGKQHLCTACMLKVLTGKGHQSFTWSLLEELDELRHTAVLMMGNKVGSLAWPALRSLITYIQGVS